MKKKFFIGCSGFYYPTWKGNFYPADLPTSKWIEYYSSVFNTLELNSTFYRLPKPAALKRYVKVTPDHFKISVKVSKYITHILRLKNSADTIKEFTELIETNLGPRLHHLLFQMPPTFKYSPENMDLIINNISPSEKNVIELRHLSWFIPEVYDTFRNEGYTICSVDYPGLPDEMISTSKVFYLRLHGTPELFKSSYATEKLKSYALQFPKGCKEYTIYFNNTYYDAGYKNALELMKIVKGI